MNAHNFVPNDARLLVLELSVAALIAQLPPRSLEEVVGMLDFIAEAAGDAQEVTATGSDGQLDHVRYWASEMLQRVMVSRKASAPDSPSCA